MFLWGWDSGFAKETEWDMGFQSLFSRASETLEFVSPFYLFSHFALSSRTTDWEKEAGLPLKLTSAKTTSW